MSVGDITSNIMLAVKGRSDTGMVEQGLAQLTMHINSLHSSLAKTRAQLNNLNKRMTAFENQTKKNTRTTRGFKIELMAMMFFWRQIGGAALGLLQPAAEAFGIMEMWSTMLLVTFIPIMEELAPLLYSLMDWFMNLPEPVQKAIGAFTLLIGAFAMTVVAAAILSAGFTTLIGLGPLFKAFFGSLIAWIDGFILSGAAAQIAVFGLALGIIFLGGYLVWLADKLGGPVELFKAIVRGAILAKSAIQDFKYGFDSFEDPNSFYQQSLNKMDLSGSWLKLKEGVEGQSLGPVAFIQDMTSQFKSAFTSIKEENAITTADITKQYENLGSGMSVVTENFKSQSQQMLDGLSASAVGSIDVVSKAASEIDKKISALSAKYANGPLVSAGGKVLSSTPNSAVISTGGIGKSNVTQKPSKKVNDFIWRAGEGAVSISPDDNLVGTKSGTPGMSGSGVVINQTINVGIAGRDEIARMIAENNKKLTADIQRIIG